MIITVSLFTSGRHTQPLIKILKQAGFLRLSGIYPRLQEKFAPADLFLVADFGQIIPTEILALPKYGSLCVHPSLLPKYRGASPVPATILAGEKETGVTIFLMDERVDHGTVIAQVKEEIRNDDTAETLYSRLFAAGAKVLLTTLPTWVEGKIKPQSQNHAEATYTKMLTREDGKIGWPELVEAIKSGQKAVEVERKIRAYSPWPGAWTLLRPSDSEGFGGQAKRLKILRAHLEPIQNTKYLPAGRQGKIQDTKLALDLVQLEGRNPVPWKQFREGYPEVKLMKADKKQI